MSEKDVATFAAGCFWGVEWAFRRHPGVLATDVGYTGGTTPNPTYEQVCSGNTGHAEAVEVRFDPAVTNFAELMQVFWRSHNPTTLNRQGPDVGTQYRSAVFTHSEEQQRVAIESKRLEDQSGRHRAPIVTSIEPFTTFYKAEAYHQQYFEKKGVDPSCHIP